MPLTQFIQRPGIHAPWMSSPNVRNGLRRDARIPATPGLEDIGCYICDLAIIQPVSHAGHDRMKRVGAGNGTGDTMQENGGKVLRATDSQPWSTHQRSAKLPPAKSGLLMADCAGAAVNHTAMCQTV